MTRRSFLLPLAVALALAQLSCAAAGLVPMQESMPAARAGLRPEYRIFYDALVDYGDWVLIEPYGFVFRPDVNFVAWRPYQHGFWVPSDVYGWVWISTEPFGWVTFHYGDWMYNDFQGWVWIPGPDWGPAWVSWTQSGDYVGWAPLMPSESYYSTVPGGAYTYVSASKLAATDLTSHLATASQLGAALSDPKPILNLVERGGVTFNRGPKIDEIERLTGPLARVRIEDVAPPGAPPTTKRREAAPAAPPRERAADPIAITRRAALEAAREAKAIAERGASSPARVPVVRPMAPREPPAGEHAAPKRGRAAPPAAPADSTR